MATATGCTGVFKIGGRATGLVTHVQVENDAGSCWPFLLTAYAVTIKTKRGFSRLEWQKRRERKEALDCRVCARAAVWIAGADRLDRSDVAQPRTADWRTGTWGR